MHNRKINEGKKCLISAELISDYNLIMSLIIHSIKKISRILRWKRPKLGYIFQHFFAPTSKWYFMSCVACNLQCVAYFWEKTSINYNYSLLLTLNSLFFNFAIRLKLCGFVHQFLLLLLCHSRTFDERPIWTRDTHYKKISNCGQKFNF